MKVKVITLVGDFERQLNNTIYELESKKDAQVVNILYVPHGKELKAVIHYVTH